MQMRVFDQYLRIISISIALGLALPTSAWANFFSYSRYMQMEILPEIQLVHDAYRNSSNPTRSSLRAMRKLLSKNKSSGDAMLLAQSYLYLSSLYIRDGNNKKAEQLLVEFQPLLQSLHNKKLQLHFESQLGAMNFSNKKFSVSIRFYQSVLDLARQLSNPLLFAITEQALGEVQLALGDGPSALASLKSAYQKLLLENENVLAADAGILYFALRSKLDERAASEIDLLKLITLIRLTPDEHKRLQQLDELSATYRELVSNKLSSEVKSEFHKIAQEAFQLSVKLQGGQRKLSTSFHLATLYERNGNYNAALDVLEYAVSSHADQKHNSELIPLYVQQGRLLMLTNSGVQSVEAYKLALQLLKKQLLTKGRTTDATMNTMLTEVYDALMILYFAQLDALGEDAANIILVKLRDLVEEKYYFYYKSLLAGEYADFERSKKTLAILSKKVAVIYPLIFDDRVELLLSLPEGLTRYTSKVKKQQLLEKVNSVRQSIETPSKKYEFQKDLMALYKWLVDPYKSKLLQKNIHSLVFVLDKNLSIIPPSVLFDKIGRRYLVEQYAIATSPGLMLTAGDVRRRQRGNLLYFGLTTHKPGFASVQVLGLERSKVSAITQSALYLNEESRLDRIKLILQSENYNNLHISIPFLLDKKFAKSRLSVFNGEMSLLLLSEHLRANFGAKQQARLDLVVLSNGGGSYKGSPYDAGMQAIAYNLGSRSAIVSLWPQAFEATPLFMSELYRNLSASSVTVATAVRRAKIRLIASKQYQHPAYWARFELIGSWL